jgi:hypothetical protein
MSVPCSNGDNQVRYQTSPLFQATLTSYRLPQYPGIIKYASNPCKKKSIVRYLGTQGFRILSNSYKNLGWISQYHRGTAPTDLGSLVPGRLSLLHYLDVDEFSDYINSYQSFIDQLMKNKSVLRVSYDVLHPTVYSASILAPHLSRCRGRPERGSGCHLSASAASWIALAFVILAQIYSVC